jgi:predicted transcriptional regulator
LIVALLPCYVRTMKNHDDTIQIRLSSELLGRLEAVGERRLANDTYKACPERFTRSSLIRQAIAEFVKKEELSLARKESEARKVER